MATVTLTKVWLHDATDLSTNITIKASLLVEKPSRVAPVRKYAGSRFRLILVPGVEKSYVVTFLHLSRSNVDQLRTWAGKLLLLRDSLGRKLYGRFDEPTFREIPIPDSATKVFRARITFDEVTHSEAV